MDSPAYHAAPLPASPTEPERAPTEPPPLPPPPFPVTAPVEDPAHSRRMLHAAAGFYGITIVFAFGYALFSGTVSTLFGDQVASAGNLLGAVVVALVVVGLCHLGDRMLPVVRRAWDALARLLAPIDKKTAVGLALVSGVAEELLFRGALWSHLGLLGTTFLFGLVHVLPRRDLLVYPLFATAVGLVMGLLRQSSGSVLPPMIVHGLVNGINLWTIARRPRPAPLPAS